MDSSVVDAGTGLGGDAGRPWVDPYGGTRASDTEYSLPELLAYVGAAPTKTDVYGIWELEHPTAKARIVIRRRLAGQRMQVAINCEFFGANKFLDGYADPSVSGETLQIALGSTSYFQEGTERMCELSIPKGTWAVDPVELVKGRLVLNSYLVRAWRKASVLDMRIFVKIANW